MTVTAAYPPAVDRTTTGTGLDTPQSTVFPFYTNNQVVVIQRTLATGAVVIMVEGTHYNLTGGLGAVGTVTPIDGATDFTTSVEWEIQRDTPILQLIDLVANVDLPSESIEEQADRGIMSQQEIEFDLNIVAASDVTENGIINGDMQVWERGVTFNLGTTPSNASNNYHQDRFRTLTDGADVVDITRSPSGTGPAGSQYAARYVQATANLKWGFFQVMEGASSWAYTRVPVSFSFKARDADLNPNTADHFRAAIIYYTGTVDDVAADPIATWNAEGSDPDLTANWHWASKDDTDVTAEHPNLASLTNIYQRFEVANITVPATAVNVAILAWVDDDTIDAGTAVDVSDVRLEASTQVHAFTHRHFQEELALCRRFYERLSEDGVFSEIVGSGSCDNITNLRVHWPFAVPKRRAVGTADMSFSAIGDFTYVAAAVIGNPDSMTVLVNGASGVALGPADSTNPFTAGEAVTFFLTGGGGAWIDVDAEL